MEYSGFCVVKSNLNKENFENALVHEIAHQWFPCVVSINEYNSGYFDEGIVENKDFLKRVSYAKSLFQVFTSEQLKTTPNYISVMKRGLNEFLSESEYDIVAYEKGFLLFHHLNNLTSNKLLKVLERYYKKNVF